MLTTLALTLVLAQTRAARPEATPAAPAAAAAKAEETDKKDDKKKEEKEEPPVVTKHTLTAGGKTLSYTATTGFLPLKTDAGETEAKVFFMAYTLDRGGAAASKRPLTFSFNGGPGSASVWLHLGALGPKRVKMKDADGMMPAPPYTVVDNEETWLADTDMVFIDPVGTGYSRPAKPELGKKFWGLDGDIASVGEFIRLYLTRYERWGSPLFLVGESYGTTRAAGLSGYLVDRGIAFNGILLVSSILNFQTARFTRGNDLPYPLFLPDVHGDGLVPQEAPRRPAGQAPARRPRRGRGVRGRRVSRRAREGRRAVRPPSARRSPRASRATRGSTPGGSSARTSASRSCTSAASSSRTSGRTSAASTRASRATTNPASPSARTSTRASRRSSRRTRPPSTST